MKRHPALLALAIAVAGCSAPRPPAEAAADTSPAGTDTPATASPEPTPAVGDTPANGNTVPSGFQGEWAADAAACTSPGHESQLRIDADRIAFHESSGAIESVAGGNPDLTIVARLTGEGETREATYRFRLSSDGNTLTDIGSGTGMVRQLCD